MNRGGTSGQVEPSVRFVHCPDPQRLSDWFAGGFAGPQVEPSVVFGAFELAAQNEAGGKVGLAVGADPVSQDVVALLGSGQDEVDAVDPYRSKVTGRHVRRPEVGAAAVAGPLRDLHDLSSPTGYIGDVPVGDLPVGVDALVFEGVDDLGVGVNGIGIWRRKLILDLLVQCGQWWYGTAGNM